jgi:hypothetical protein
MRSRFTLLTPADPAEPAGLIQYAARQGVIQASDNLITLGAGYFKLNGILCGIGSAYAWLTLVVSALLPFHWSAPARFVALGASLGTMMCFANLRTARLLEDRRRSGAVLAFLYFAATLSGLGHSGLDWTVALGAVGLVLTASVWKYLD